MFYSKIDILDSLSIFLRIMQATGLTQLRTTDNKKLYYSKILIGYSILSVIVFLMAFLFGIFTQNFYVSEASSDVGSTVDFIQLIGVRTAHIVAIVESICRKNEQKRFFEKIMEVDSIFERRLNMDMQHKKFRSRCLFSSLGMASLYIGSEFFVLSVFLYTGKSDSTTYWLAYFISLMVTGTRYLQIYVSVVMIKNRFDKINMCLRNAKLVRKELITNKSNSKSETKMVKIVAMFDTDHRLRRNGSEAIIFSRLIILRDIYDRLWELTNLVNQMYGISILINLGNDFVSITSNCYWMFLSFKEVPDSLEDLLRTVGSTVWSVPHFFNVIILAAICHWTVQSAGNIALAAHKIEIDTSNDNHNAFIEQFSLQLLHQKIQFTAFGFFNIDFTLLYTIVGATTTYLVILIQFHMNEQKGTTDIISTTIPTTVSRTIIINSVN